MRWCRHRASPAVRRELHRHDPDTPGRAADQHRLTGSEAGPAQAKAGYRPRTAERHRVGGRQARRKGNQGLRRGDRLLGIAAAQPGERPHPLADPRSVNAVADRAHHAGDLAAGDMTLGETVGGEGAAPDDGIDAADADRLGGDLHLPADGLGSGSR